MEEKKAEMESTAEEAEQAESGKFWGGQILIDQPFPFIYWINKILIEYELASKLFSMIGKIIVFFLILVLILLS